MKVLGQAAAARPGAIDHRRPAKAVKEWIDRLPDARFTSRVEACNALSPRHHRDARAASVQREARVLDELDLPSAAIERICVAMAIVDAVDRQMLRSSASCACSRAASAAARPSGRTRASAN
jgi:hypothetical protein